MKKTIIASCVAGLIIFVWQFLSWSALNLHQPAQQYTPKQEALLNFLNSQGLEEGGYLLPSLPEGATMKEWTKMEEEAAGKPWASIQYHRALETNMGLNMFRGLVTNILTVFLLCWVLRLLPAASTRQIFTASLFTGLIVFLNAHYTNAIWYETFDLQAHLLDAVVSWGLTGLWLAWWYGRKQPTLSTITVSEGKETSVAD